MLRLPTQTPVGVHARAKGYTLSVLLAMMVTLGVLIVDRARMWAPTQINREREAELIYRGEHLARGIAAYRQRRGRFPISLGEVASIRPRIIREIYKDPMTESGEWIYIYNVPTSPSGNNEGLPIVGVRSSSNRDSIKVYRGKSLHSDWEFSALDPLLGGTPMDQNRLGGPAMRLGGQELSGSSDKASGGR
jgi:hypothetical protein